jgi:hypothetical protein
MSRQSWEYASVLWQDRTRKITEADPEFSRLSAEYVQKGIQYGWTDYWWREQTYFIWLPGAEKADVRVAWESDWPEYRVNALEINNELGAAGWELVTVVVRGSRMGENLGWSTASAPILVASSFKRPVIGD